MNATEHIPTWSDDVERRLAIVRLAPWFIQQFKEDRVPLSFGEDLRRLIGEAERIRSVLLAVTL